MTTLERATQAFERSLAAQAETSFGHFVGTLPDGYNPTSVTIDGEFNLLIAMRAALTALREPTSHMILGLEQLSYAADPGEAVDYWTAMIDAILEEKPEG